MHILPTAQTSATTRRGVSDLHFAQQRVQPSSLRMAYKYGWPSNGIFVHFPTEESFFVYYFIFSI